MSFFCTKYFKKRTYKDLELPTADEYFYCLAWPAPKTRCSFCITAESHHPALAAARTHWLPVINTIMPKPEQSTPKHPWLTDHLNFTWLYGLYLWFFQRLSYQLQSLKPCQGRACCAFSPHLHASLLVKLVDVAISYSSCVSDVIKLFLLTAVYWKPASSCSKKKVLVMQKTFSQKLLQKGAPWNGGIISFKVQQTCPSNWECLSRPSQVQRDYQRNK